MADVTVMAILALIGIVGTTGVILITRVDAGGPLTTHVGGTLFVATLAYVGVVLVPRLPTALAVPLGSAVCILFVVFVDKALHDPEAYVIGLTASVDATLDRLGRAIERRPGALATLYVVEVAVLAAGGAVAYASVGEGDWRSMTPVGIEVHERRPASVRPRTSPAP